MSQIEVTTPLLNVQEVFTPDSVKKLIFCESMLHT